MMPPPALLSPDGILIDTSGTECCCGDDGVPQGQCPTAFPSIGGTPACDCSPTFALQFGGLEAFDVHGNQAPGGCSEIAVCEDDGSVHRWISEHENFSCPGNPDPPDCDTQTGEWGGHASLACINGFWQAAILITWGCFGRSASWIFHQTAGAADTCPPTGDYPYASSSSGGTTVTPSGFCTVG